MVDIATNLENKMVDIDGNLTEIWRIFGGYLADMLERIYGKIWWILPKAGKQNGGYTRKHIVALLK